MTFWNSQMTNFINKIHLCSWHPSVVERVLQEPFLLNFTIILKCYVIIKRCINR